MTVVDLPDRAQGDLTLRVASVAAGNGTDSTTGLSDHSACQESALRTCPSRSHESQAQFTLVVGAAYPGHESGVGVLDGPPSRSRSQPSRPDLGRSRVFHQLRYLPKGGGAAVVHVVVAEPDACSTGPNRLRESADRTGPRHLPQKSGYFDGVQIRLFGIKHGWCLVGMA